MPRFRLSLGCRAFDKGGSYSERDIHNAVGFSGMACAVPRKCDRIRRVHEACKLQHGCQEADREDLMDRGKQYGSWAAYIALLLLVFSLNRPGESARHYQYRVLNVTGMSELRTQSDADRGRVKSIENLIEEQVAQGWEFYQADGYILYFRK